MNAKKPKKGGRFPLPPGNRKRLDRLEDAHNGLTGFALETRELALGLVDLVHLAAALVRLGVVSEGRQVEAIAEARAEREQALADGTPAASASLRLSAALAGKQLGEGVSS